jgi:hypothetical protein
MDTQGQTSWLLDARLRNVLERYIANRCLMLRYTLSRVCRALWYRLRNEHFLRFAEVVSGHAILREDEELSFKEECVRWIYPDVVVGYGFLGGFEHNFWAQCRWSIDKRDIILYEDFCLGAKPTEQHLWTSIRIPWAYGLHVSKRMYHGEKLGSTTPCRCLGISCVEEARHVRGVWRLESDSLRRELILVLIKIKRL